MASSARSLLSRAVFVIRRRPSDFLSALWQYSLFTLTGLLRKLPLFERSNISLQRNVRLQRLGCLRAELPDASISVGEDSIIYERALIEAFGQGEVRIGKKCILGEIRVCSRASVHIGDGVLSSWQVFIQDFDPHPLDPSLRKKQVDHMVESFLPRYESPRGEVTREDLDWEFPSESVRIGDNVWLGAGVTILKGAHIGSGSVVAASAVVTRGVYPPNSLLAGNPARVIKNLEPKGEGEA